MFVASVLQVYYLTILLHVTITDGAEPHAQGQPNFGMAQFVGPLPAMQSMINGGVGYSSSRASGQVNNPVRRIPFKVVSPKDMTAGHTSSGSADDAFKSEWTLWSTWSKCASGQRVRVRGCYRVSGFTCEGENSQAEMCSSQDSGTDEGYGSQPQPQPYSLVPSSQRVDSNDQSYGGSTNMGYGSQTSGYSSSSTSTGGNYQGQPSYDYYSYDNSDTTSYSENSNQNYYDYYDQPSTDSNPSFYKVLSIPGNLDEKPELTMVKVGTEPQLEQHIVGQLLKNSQVQMGVQPGLENIGPATIIASGASGAVPGGVSPGAQPLPPGGGVMTPLAAALALPTSGDSAPTAQPMPPGQRQDPMRFQGVSMIGNSAAPGGLPLAPGLATTDDDDSYGMKSSSYGTIDDDEELDAQTLELLAGLPGKIFDSSGPPGTVPQAPGSQQKYNPVARPDAPGSQPKSPAPQPGIPHYLKPGDTVVMMPSFPRPPGIHTGFMEGFGPGGMSAGPIGANLPTSPSADLAVIPNNRPVATAPGFGPVNGLGGMMGAPTAQPQRPGGLPGGAPTAQPQPPGSTANVAFGGPPGTNPQPPGIPLLIPGVNVQPARPHTSGLGRPAQPLTAGRRILSLGPPGTVYGALQLLQNHGPHGLSVLPGLVQNHLGGDPRRPSFGPDEPGFLSKEPPGTSIIQPTSMPILPGTPTGGFSTNVVLGANQPKPPGILPYGWPSYKWPRVPTRFPAPPKVTYQKIPKNSAYGSNATPLKNNNQNKPSAPRGNGYAPMPTPSNGYMSNQPSMDSYNKMPSPSTSYAKDAPAVGSTGEGKSRRRHRVKRAGYPTSPHTYLVGSGAVFLPFSQNSPSLKNVSDGQPSYMNRSQSPMEFHSSRGQWTQWNEWTGCNCGTQSRTRTCTYRVGGFYTLGCFGPSYQQNNCTEGETDNCPDEKTPEPYTPLFHVQRVNPLVQYNIVRYSPTHMRQFVDVMSDMQKTAALNGASALPQAFYAGPASSYQKGTFGNFQYTSGKRRRKR